MPITILVSGNKRCLKCPNCGKICTLTLYSTYQDDQRIDIDVDFGIIISDSYNEPNKIIGKCKHCGYELFIEDMNKDAVITEQISKDGYFVDYDEENPDVIKKIKFWYSIYFIAGNCKNTVTVLDATQLNVLKRRFWNYRFVNDKLVKRHSSSTKYNNNVFITKDTLFDFIDEIESNTQYKLFNPTFLSAMKSVSKIGLIYASIILARLKYTNVIIDDKYRLVGEFYKKFTTRRLVNKIKESNSKLIKLTYYDLAEIILAKKPTKYKNFDLEKFKMYVEFAKVFDLFRFKRINELLYDISYLSHVITDFRVLLRYLLVSSVVVLPFTKQTTQYKNILSMLKNVNDFNEVINQAIKYNAVINKIYPSNAYYGIKGTELDKLLKSVYAAI